MSQQPGSFPATTVVACVLGLIACLAVPGILIAQTPVGAVQGQVTHAGSDRPLRGITVAVLGSRAAAVTDAHGRYTLRELSPGDYALRFAWQGYAARDVNVTVRAGATETVDVSLEPDPIPLAAITVTSASRQPERVVDAPAAVSVVTPSQIRDLSGTGQIPLLVADLTGVQAVQNGVADFSINARGFNSPTNRKLLVLVDGRDVSIPLLGNQEWPALSTLEHAARVELVRGPGSALYGANAFTGVLNIVTPSIRQARGTRVAVATGDPTSYRVDARHAAVTRDLRWGYRASGGYWLAETWDRSRTALGHLEREYGDAADEIRTPLPGYELRALEGQTKEGPFGLPGEVRGDADPLRSYYGEVRFDRYLADGSVLTAEGGASRVENLVFATTVGRSQGDHATRPWARLAWAADAFNVTAWYSGRAGRTWSLNSATAAEEDSHTLHVEGQLNRHFSGGRGRIVVGGSIRNQSIDTQGTLYDPVHDGRSDQYYGVFGQLEYDLHQKVKLIAASRVDEGTLLETQFSPKLGVVFSPDERHALRATASRAFLTPSPLERFVRFPIAPPQDLSGLEAGLRQSPLGPLLAGVPSGTLFGASSTVPVLLLGNDKLEPQRVISYEAGYKGERAGRIFYTLDMFYAETEDFVTGAMPGINPAYGPWTAPAAVDANFRSVVEGAVIGVVGPSFTRLADGSSAFVYSLGTAGRATEWGLELGAGVRLSTGLRLDGNYTFYDFDIDQSRFAPGDSVLPNTPRHSGNVTVSFERAGGTALRAAVHLVDAFEWRTGLYRGRVPARQTLDLSASQPLSTTWRVSGVATNVLDQRRFQLYGGSLIRRRVVIGLTWDR